MGPGLWAPGGTGTRDEPLRTSQERLRGRLTSPLRQKKSGEETLFSSPDFSEGWGMSVHRLIHEQYSAVTVSGQSVDSGYQRGWAIPVTERKLVVAIQSRFDTSVFDTNSRSEIAQKIVHFQYSLRVDKKSILGEYFSFFKPRTSNHVHLN